MTIRDSVKRVWGPPDGEEEVDTEESDLERCQRNFSELLQELRVAQAGVQILFAFLLTLAFSGRMEDSGAFDRGVYVVALLTAAASSALLTAPVAQHRILFRLGRKPYLVRSSHRMASAGLLLLLVSMVASVLLAVDAVVPQWLAWMLTVLVAFWFVGLWAVLPWTQRSPRQERPAGRVVRLSADDEAGASEARIVRSDEDRHVDGSRAI